MSEPTEEVKQAAARQPILGLPEIADLLEVDRYTPARWNERGVLPPPACHVSRRTPVWFRPRIVEWALSTNRLPRKHWWELPVKLRAEAEQRDTPAESGAEPSSDASPTT